MKKMILILLGALALNGCSSYEVGDPLIQYCNAATPEIRAAMQKILSDRGVVLTVDYCDAILVLDAIVDKKDE